MFIQLSRIQSQTELSHILVDLINAIPKTSSLELVAVKLKCLKNFVNSPFFEETGNLTYCKNHSFIYTSILDGWSTPLYGFMLSYNFRIKSHIVAIVCVPAEEAFDTLPRSEALC